MVLPVYVSVWVHFHWFRKHLLLFKPFTAIDFFWREKVVMKLSGAGFVTPLGLAANEIWWYPAKMPLFFPLSLDLWRWSVSFPVHLVLVSVISIRLIDGGRKMSLYQQTRGHLVCHRWIDHTLRVEGWLLCQKQSPSQKRSSMIPQESSDHCLLHFFHKTASTSVSYHLQLARRMSYGLFLKL